MHRVWAVFPFSKILYSATTTIPFPLACFYSVNDLYHLIRTGCLALSKLVIKSLQVMIKKLGQKNGLGTNQFYSEIECSHFLWMNSFRQGDLHKWRPLLPWFFEDSKLKEILKNLNNNIKKSWEIEGCGSKIRPATLICILKSKWPYLAQFRSCKKN